MPDNSHEMRIAAVKGTVTMMIFETDTLTVFQSALFQTNSAVVQTADCIVVADPTWLPSEVAEIAAYVQSVRRGRPLYLLFTHSDFDHILGAGAFPDAETLASREFVNNPEFERNVAAVRAWDSEYYVTRPYAITYPRIDVIAETDGQELSVGGTRLTLYQAPGHNPDGLWTVIEPAGILLAGDYLSDIEFPYIYQSSPAYEATLAKLDPILARHTVNVLVPGHGAVTNSHAEMRRRRDDSLAYIHTLRRHLTADDQAALDQMLEGTAFPLGMKRFHDGNQTLMRAEKVCLP